MSENGRNQGEGEGWDAKVEDCCRGGEIPAYGAPSGACFKASRRLSFSSCRSRPEPTHRPSAGAFSFRPLPSPPGYLKIPTPPH